MVGILHFIEDPFNAFGPVLYVQLAGVLMPVVVWVHGGSFTFGSGGVEECDPEYWMRRDVVVVTFNYRLGVLGQYTLSVCLLFVSCIQTFTFEFKKVSRSPLGHRNRFFENYVLKAISKLKENTR